MPRNAQWGEQRAQLERFIVDAGGTPAAPLTVNFTDNAKIGVLQHTDDVLLLVDYTKGDEKSVEIEVSFRDADVGDATFFVEQTVDDAGVVDEFLYELKTSRLARIPIPVGMREDRIQVRVRATGPGAGPFTGTLELFFGLMNLRGKRALDDKC